MAICERVKTAGKAERFNKYVGTVVEENTYEYVKV